MDDADNAFRWLREQGRSPYKIGISGISAGALLATQLIYRYQENQTSLPS
ncbi:MAG: alpha/beta hydrolase [Planctomycetaceae bacterium]|nr:alpha/beta hydrolase [Planctomycetaceae bacterium]